MELNRKELEHLFSEIIKNVKHLKESIMFNLYEDAESYSVEASFDDENFVVCRDNPAILCSNEIDFKKVLKEIKKEIKVFVTDNEKIFKDIQEVSFGFVDGDLFYIKKAKKQKYKIKTTFTFEDFKDFNSLKLIMWLEMYLTNEAKERYNPPTIFNYETLTEEDLKKWKHILLDNFDYNKYNHK